MVLVNFDVSFVMLRKTAVNTKGLVLTELESAV